MALIAAATFQAWGTVCPATSPLFCGSVTAKSWHREFAGSWMQVRVKWIYLLAAENVSIPHYSARGLPCGNGTGSALDRERVWNLNVGYEVVTL